MNQIPKSIKKIINQLTDNISMNNQDLIKIVENSAINEEELLQYSTFDHSKSDSYGRNTVFTGKNFGIYVMSWSPGDFTAIHNHGHSDWGVVCFFGNTNHRTYTVKDKKISLDKKEILKKGTIAPVCGNLVHSMGNSSNIPVITLHIYGSNSYHGTVTEDSKMYEIEKNRILTTLGPAFLNIKDELCKSEEFGIEIDDETKNDYFNFIKDFYNRNNIKI